MEIGRMALLLYGILAEDEAVRYLGTIFNGFLDARLSTEDVLLRICPIIALAIGPCSNNSLSFVFHHKGMRSCSNLWWRKFPAWCFQELKHHTLLQIEPRSSGWWDTHPILYGAKAPKRHCSHQTFFSDLIKHGDARQVSLLLDLAIRLPLLTVRPLLQAHVAVHSQSVVVMYTILRNKASSVELMGTLGLFYDQDGCNKNPVSDKVVREMREEKHGITRSQKCTTCTFLPSPPGLHSFGGTES